MLGCVKMGIVGEKDQVQKGYVQTLRTKLILFTMFYHVGMCLGFIPLPEGAHSA